MSKYIDTDAWWNEAQKLYTNGDSGDEDRYKVGINVGITKSRNAMKRIPSIDIVRCKECRHWAYGKDLCTLHDMGMMADDFCSYGEVRDEKCKECWYWSEVHKRCENKCGCQFKPYGEREGE